MVVICRQYLVWRLGLFLDDTDTPFNVQSLKVISRVHTLSHQSGTQLIGLPLRSRAYRLRSYVFGRLYHSLRCVSI